MLPGTFSHLCIPTHKPIDFPLAVLLDLFLISRLWRCGVRSQRFRVVILIAIQRHYRPVFKDQDVIVYLPDPRVRASRPIRHHGANRRSHEVTKAHPTAY